MIRSGFYLLAAATAFYPAFLAAGQTASPSTTGSIAGQLSGAGGATPAAAAITCASAARDRVQRRRGRRLQTLPGHTGFRNCRPAAIRCDSLPQAMLRLRSGMLR